MTDLYDEPLQRDRVSEVIGSRALGILRDAGGKLPVEVLFDRVREASDVNDDDIIVALATIESFTDLDGFVHVVR